ncbi:hypothetical protein KXQ82_07155 [Mucilaginibacter sp. HMF5004]|uniref:hypothetical protein n=1 Tax=Mucilaginibacter rivuli TaxID=2857527 RepID=UPI001C5FF6F5|nr:hypothetical protein [Mucilaginibacter rivuli]MBW4889485.1 hypothetical protein [Mucilaginibacter rivuli]
MKPAYLLFISFLFTASVYGQYTYVPYSNGVEMPNRRLAANHISTQSAYTYRFGNKGIKDSVLLWTKHYKYNELGQLVRMEIRESGKKNTYTKYQYNQNNYLVKQVQVTERSKTKADSVLFDFDYDAFGNQQFIGRFTKDTSDLQITHQIYNSKNQLISVLIKVNEADFFTSQNLTYNENGDLSILAYLDAAGNTINEYYFSYDYPAKKQMVSVIKNNKRKLYQAFTYNINKDRIRFEEFNYVDYSNIANANPNAVTKYYDDKGLLGTEVTYQGGTLINYVKYMYAK